MTNAELTNQALSELAKTVGLSPTELIEIRADDTLQDALTKFTVNVTKCLKHSYMTEQPTKELEPNE